MGGKRYSFYPPSLGKVFLTGNVLRSIGLDLKGNPFKSCLKAVGNHKDEVCVYLAYSTYNDRESLLDATKIGLRAKEFSEVDVKDLASCLLAVVTDIDIESFINDYGLDKEKDKMRKIAKVKGESGNTISFGGKSILGGLVIPACEKLNMTPQEVIWGISFPLLLALMADMETSVYLSDEERKKLHINANALSGDDPRTLEKLRMMNQLER
jgi:hypothetical protein